MNDTAKANLYALGAIALWASLATLGVALSHVPAFALTGLALIIGSVPTWGRWRLWRVSRRALALGIYGLFGFHFLLFIALRHAPPVQANLVNYLWPLFIVVLAPLLLPGLHLRPVHVLAAALGFAGAALAILGGRSLDAAWAWGYLPALASALVWATFSLGSRRLAQAGRGFPTAALGLFGLVSGVLALVLAALVTPARAEYRLQPGDVLEVLVAGIPDFRQHLTVGLEGNIGLPLAGEVKVGGLPLTQAQQRIAAGLGNKLYRQYTPDGREISHLIIGSEVVVEVSEYSPIYVSGDVAKPGAYPFRPGLTIRQAIAVAGGYNPMRIPGTDPMLQAADLQSQYQTFMTEYQADIALTWRLNRELNDDGQASSDKQPAAPVGVAEAFVKGEIKQFDARKADRESVKAMLQDAMKKASLQLA
ncbi:MAG: hypothetical protein B7Z83_07980, partial [Thiomonas sp. 20-64-5]